MERKNTPQQNPWNTLKAELKAKFILYLDTFKIRKTTIHTYLMKIVHNN